jgi:hypothetical protein
LFLSFVLAAMPPKQTKETSTSTLPEAEKGAGALPLLR